MTDEETADVLRDTIDAYLNEVDPDYLDSDDLAWSLVHALRRATQQPAPPTPSLGEETAAPGRTGGAPG
ncbi:hypothetical protein [Streptomyces antimicrobicus]|uniref:Uncharacterized protein n=1 Tax=Streptomyces antimicrobicus TaxID=2883108 RepID=A0ABS8BA66_9ACTN|nr:hypothetical protein [Streptomyces antimicrobicus]MCB5181515.1 hypothetical protein [Streptomyces antimicrobicus]